MGVFISAFLILFISGGVLGALVGFTFTLFNNLILHQHFGAAFGNYLPWIRFFAVAGFIFGAVLSMIWGATIFFLQQK